MLPVGVINDGDDDNSRKVFWLNKKQTLCVRIEVLLMVAGAMVNGPYSLITTAVAADLGTHPCLHGNAKALATVSAIIDGTGSIGNWPTENF